MIEWDVGQRVVYHDDHNNKDLFGVITEILTDRAVQQEGEDSFFVLYILWEGHKESYSYSANDETVKRLKPATTLPENNPNVKFRKEYVTKS